MGSGTKSWMNNLDTNLKNMPLIFLAIPGSHDCMTYTIPPSAEISPDNEPAVEVVAKVFGKFGRKYIHRWCVTQDMTVLEQLNIGIRYMDFRVATKDDSNNVYFCHGLYGGEVSTYLNEINGFLDENKGEIVILDFQHFYGFTRKVHDVLINERIKHTFGDKLCPFPTQVKDVTLSWMLKNGYQVIVIYRDKEIEDLKLDGLWPGPAWPTPWPNTSSVNSLQQFLRQKLSTRPTDRGFVTQCLLTPDAKTLGWHPWGSLKGTCAQKVLKKVKPWLMEQQPGPAGINVVICDFVNTGGLNSVVIDLNNYFSKR